MTDAWLNIIEASKNTDGMVEVNFEQLKILVDERKMYKNDVQITVSNIKKLLTQLGIITPDGELRFKFSSLVKSLNKVLWNQDAAAKEFNYLADLGGIIERYKDVATENIIEDKKTMV